MLNASHLIAYLRPPIGAEGCILYDMSNVDLLLFLEIQKVEKDQLGSLCRKLASRLIVYFDSPHQAGSWLKKKINIPKNIQQSESLRDMRRKETNICQPYTNTKQELVVVVSSRNFIQMCYFLISGFIFY